MNIPKEAWMTVANGMAVFLILWGIAKIVDAFGWIVRKRNG